MLSPDIDGKCTFPSGDEIRIAATRSSPLDTSTTSLFSTLHRTCGFAPSCKADAIADSPQIGPSVDAGFSALVGHFRVASSFGQRHPNLT